MHKPTRPLTKNTPNTHDANSWGDKPPRVPTDKMMATGPVAAKMKPISALVAYVAPKSERICRQFLEATAGVSRCLNKAQAF